jgi:hypothetical protein
MRSVTAPPSDISAQAQFLPYQPDLTVTPSSPTVRRVAGPSICEITPGCKVPARWALTDRPRAACPVPRVLRVDYAGRFGLEEHDGVVASDHYGIFADLELTDPF